MLGKVASNNKEELMEEIKIGDLPTHRLKITGDDSSKAEVTKLSDGTPKCRFTTPWILGKSGCFRIDLAIIGPKTEHIKDALPFPGRKAEHEIQRIAHLVKSLKKALGR
jgi:hypothetical protein